MATTKICTRDLNLSDTRIKLQGTDAFQNGAFENNEEHDPDEK